MRASVTVRKNPLRRRGIADRQLVRRAPVRELDRKPRRFSAVPFCEGVIGAVGKLERRPADGLVDRETQVRSVAGVHGAGSSGRAGTDTVVEPVVGAVRTLIRPAADETALPRIEASESDDPAEARIGTAVRMRHRVAIATVAANDGGCHVAQPLRLRVRDHRIVFNFTLPEVPVAVQPESIREAVRQRELRAERDRYRQVAVEDVHRVDVVNRIDARGIEPLFLIRVLLGA
jgi:hypothetical protein